jgi:hypothetical protein
MNSTEAEMALDDIQRVLGVAKRVIAAQLSRRAATCTPTCNANLVPGMAHNCALGVRVREIVDRLVWETPAARREIEDVLISASNSGLLSLWER